MPNFDKTGPKGAGSKTGLGRGHCSDKHSALTTSGRGRGRGMGKGNDKA